MKFAALVIIGILTLLFSAGYFDKASRPVVKAPSISVSFDDNPPPATQPVPVAQPAPTATPVAASTPVAAAQPANRSGDPMRSEKGLIEILPTGEWYMPGGDPPDGFTDYITHPSGIPVPNCWRGVSTMLFKGENEVVQAGGNDVPIAIVPGIRYKVVGKPINGGFQVKVINPPKTCSPR